MENNRFIQKKEQNSKPEPSKMKQQIESFGMNIETCYKYVEFLNIECDRYLKDRKIDENEIHQLKIELDKFLKEVNKSDLPVEIKNKMANLKLEYEFNGKGEYVEILGRWNFGKNRRQRKLNKMVEDFKHQINGIPMFIKMNY